VRFQPGENEDIANCDGESAADKDRNHPPRKKRTSNVHNGITTSSKENKRRKDQNPKSEYRNPKQTCDRAKSQTGKIQNTKSASSFEDFLKLGHLNLFRISCFEFIVIEPWRFRGKQIMSFVAVLAALR
jgi:hypothetical protein